MATACTGSFKPMTAGTSTRRRLTRIPIPKSTFTTYMDEGLLHLKKLSYRKAKYCFDRALELVKDDPLALISRSTCNLHLGLHDEALADAERTFQVDQKFAPGLYHMGETLFSLGFFEKALSCFHQGRHLRKNFQPFYTGIKKAEHAIKQAILDKNATRIEDLEEILPLIEEIEVEDQLKEHQCCIRAISAETLLENRVPLLPPKNKEREKWVTAEFLGPLAAHKFFVRRLLKKLSDPRYRLATSARVYENVAEILFFIEHHQRLLQWMKPMYYRKKGLNCNKSTVLHVERHILEQKQTNLKVMKDAAETAVLKNMIQIEHALSIGRNGDAQLTAERSLRMMKKISPAQVPRKEEFIMEMTHYQGIAYSRQKQYSDAASSFKKELKLGMKNNNEIIISRALDFLARSQAFNENYGEAIEAWENRFDYIKTPLEKAYTHHEIGRAYLELGKRELARYYAIESLNVSMEYSITVWAVFSRVLLGQIELKANNYKDALFQFQSACDVCKGEESKGMCKMLEEICRCIVVILEKKDQEKKDDTDSDRGDEPMGVTSRDDSMP